MGDDLTGRTCTPCKGDVQPVGPDEIEDYLAVIDDGWEAVDGHHIEREFGFDDFEEALAFVNEVGEVAEAEGHHPVIEFTWGRATVRLYTHKIDGLHENDFILAAKIDEVYADDFA